MYQRVWLTTDVICKKMDFGNYKISTNLVFHKKQIFDFLLYIISIFYFDKRLNSQFDKYELSNQTNFFAHDSHTKFLGKSAEFKKIIRSDQVQREVYKRVHRPWAKQSTRELCQIRRDLIKMHFCGALRNSVWRERGPKVRASFQTHRT